MKSRRIILVVFAVVFWAFSVAVSLSEATTRNDGAQQVNIPLSGSLQNPAWSPDGESILFTRFRSGYNRGPADLIIFNLKEKSIRVLVLDGSTNVNLPGSTWNSVTNQIVFSSSRKPHDEIFIIDEDGRTGDEEKITDRRKKVAYEPSLSPDGRWIVFESHPLDIAAHGVLMKCGTDGTKPYQLLTGKNEDCRQPNWSPAGDLIVYQKVLGRQWDIWVMKTNGKERRKVTKGPGNKTDASFSPDGKWIVYSSERDDIKFANLFIIPLEGGHSLRTSKYGGYDGAPSWSPDGARIIFESCPTDPDHSAGTTLWVIDAPRL